MVYSVARYKITPIHMHIKISAELNVFGDWGGESVVMQVDRKTVWARQFYSEEAIEHPCPKLVALSVAVESVVEHKEEEVEVRFISSDRKHPCDGSFGIDDLIVSFK